MEKKLISMLTALLLFVGVASAQTSKVSGTVTTMEDGVSVPVIGATFKSLLISRLPAAGINAILQSAGLFIIIKNSTLLHKFSGGNKS